MKLYDFCLNIAYIARRRHSYIESQGTYLVVNSSLDDWGDLHFFLDTTRLTTWSKSDEQPLDRRSVLLGKHSNLATHTGSVRERRREVSHRLYNYIERLWIKYKYSYHSNQRPSSAHHKTQLSCILVQVVTSESSCLNGRCSMQSSLWWCGCSCRASKHSKGEWWAMLRIVEWTEVLKPILEDLQLQATSVQLPSNIETAITACKKKKLGKC